MVQRCKLPGEPICQILEEQTGERVGSFGSRGQGPGEFIAAEFIGKTEGDDTLYFVNLPSTVLLYAREEKGADYRYVGSEKIKVKDGCFTTRFCRLSNGYSVATTLSGGKEFFILFDRDFKEIKRFGNHPVRGMTTEANDFMQLQLKTHWQRIGKYPFCQFSGKGRYIGLTFFHIKHRRKPYRCDFFIQLVVCDDLF